MARSHEVVTSASGTKLVSPNEVDFKLVAENVGGGLVLADVIDRPGLP